jgi:hypothetical protein
MELIIAKFKKFVFYARARARARVCVCVMYVGMYVCISAF